MVEGDCDYLEPDLKTCGAGWMQLGGLFPLGRRIVLQVKPLARGNNGQCELQSSSSQARILCGKDATHQFITLQEIGRLPRRNS